MLLFGVGRIGKLGGELGRGIRAFREGLKGDEDVEDKTAQAEAASVETQAAPQEPPAMETAAFEPPSSDQETTKES